MIFTFYILWWDGVYIKYGATIFSFIFMCYKFINNGEVYSAVKIAEYTTQMVKK